MSAARVTLILGRDGMGYSESDEQAENDFELWIEYVRAHVNDECGFDVDVEARRRGDVQETKITPSGTFTSVNDLADHEDQCVAVDFALGGLFEAYWEDRQSKLDATGEPGSLVRTDRRAS